MNFKDDFEFLGAYTDVLCLNSKDKKSLVAVVPQYQGRVMTSSAAGMDGTSFGWINRAAVGSSERSEQINLFGGEERFWLAPEGGQYSIFFSPESEGHNMEDWKVPALIDSEAWECVKQSSDCAAFEKNFSIRNRANFLFEGNIKRKISIIEREELSDIFEFEIAPGLDIAGYKSENTIKNTGGEKWSCENGVPAVWLLGMLNSSDETNIVIPFKAGVDPGDAVKDDYFGRPPAERFKIDGVNNVVYFKGDGNFRAKIGITPKAAKNILGSYDAVNKVLTAVKFQLPGNAQSLPYVNSRWEHQNAPFYGDAINSYNDGPNELGGRFGDFYELETLSPAAVLAPGENLSHEQLTVHFQGSEHELDQIARKLFAVSLDDIKNAFKAEGK